MSYPNHRNGIDPIVKSLQGQAKSLVRRDLVIRGAGGGKSGGAGGGRTPEEETDTLSSMQVVKVKDALSEGEVEGWGKPQYLRCIAVNGTRRWKTKPGEAARGVFLIQPAKYVR